MSFLLLALDLLLALHGDGAVGDAHVDVLLVEAGQLDGHLDPAVGLDNVRAGRAFAERGGEAAERAVGPVPETLERPVHVALERDEGAFLLALGRLAARPGDEIP